MRFFLFGTFMVRAEFFIFSRPSSCFHGWDLAENFTGTVDFSWVVSKTFSREGNFFHGRKSINFHGRVFYFFHGKKKTGGGVRMMALEKRYVDPWSFRFEYFVSLYK